MKKLILVLLATIVIGSTLQAQWVQTNGPYGGSIRELFIKGSDIFAASRIGSLYRSTDNGSNWIAVNNGLENSSIISFTFSGDNIFVGTSGVYLSTNNGTSWNAVNNGLPNFTSIYNLVVFQNKLYASTYSDLYTSDDNGSNWEKLNSWTAHSKISSFAITDSIIFIGTLDSGIFLSTDNGLSFNSANNGLTNLEIFSLKIKQTQILAGTKNGIFISTDYGANWARISDGLPDLPARVITVKNNIIFAGFYKTQYHNNFITGGVYYSTNNGTSWVTGNNGLNHLGISTLVTNGDNIFAGTNGGVYISTNSGSDWEAVNNGLSNSYVNHITKNGNNIYVSTPRNGVFVSDDLGNTWLPIISELPKSPISSTSIMSNNIFIATQGQGIIHSSNEGTSWQNANNGVTDSVVFSLETNENYILAGTVFDGIFRSTDLGVNWNMITPSFHTHDMAIIGESILACPDAESTVQYSPDNGATWLTTQISSSNVAIEDFVVKGNIVFAGTRFDGVYISTNYGADWQTVNTGLTKRSIWALASNEELLFAGATEYNAGKTTGYVFLSIDNGSTWNEVTDNLSVAEINYLEIFNYNLFIGTLGRGVWRRPLTDFITDLNDEINTPTNFSLEQNYPNPFNPTTTIKYSIPQSVGNEDFRSVQLKIYDVLGNEIATLVNEQKSPGSYEVKFDGSEHASGIYFYQLKAGSSSETKKFVLMK